LLNHYTKAQINLRINKTYDYIIEKVASTYYATGRGSLTNYSNADATIVINSAITQLTTGGSIFVKRGLYDGLSTLVFTNGNITLEGENWNTKLKLKASADAGTSWGNLIYCGGVSGITIKNLELNGNGLNQTKIANRTGVDKSRSIGVCANDTASATATNNLIVENCYIHDFARDGVVWSTGTNATIRDCYFKNNFVAQVEFWGLTNNGKIENSYLRNGTGVSLFGNNHAISDCRFEYFYNAHMWDATDYGITLESSTYGPDNVMITDCIFKGDTLTEAIFTGTGGMRNLTINNILIKSSDPDHYGIYLEKDTNTLITGSHIIGTKYPIITLGSQSATISNNHIDGNPIGGYSGIYLDAASDSINVMNNYIKMQSGRPIELVTGATDNIITGNILDGIWGDMQIVDAGTGTVIFNNYSLLTDSKLPEKVGNILNTGTITDATGITVAMLSEFMYYNEGAATDISANPQIVDGRNGQKITIIGSSDTNTLTLDDGNGLQLAGAAQCVLGAGDTITLIYSSGLDIWVEVSRSNN
jgi:hypothetical protein